MSGRRLELISRPRVAIAPAVVLTIGAALFVWLRVRFGYDDFPNPDMAGMAFNADLLLRGGLPYRDSVELKSPATFFVYAATFAWLGRSLVLTQVVYAVWLASGGVAIGMAARRLYGDGHGVSLAVGVGLYAWTAASFAPNYSAWMMPAYAWAFAALLEALARPTWRWHVVAGAWATIAYLLKTHACVLAIVFPLTWWWARRRDFVGATWGAWPAWIAGAALGMLPLVVVYARHDAVADLLAGVFPFAAAGDYGSSAASPRWDLGGHVLAQWLSVFPFAAALTLAAAVAAQRARRLGELGPALVLFGAGVLAAGLGGQRYYLHYLVQYVPGMALCVAHPAWLAALSFGDDRLRGRGLGVLAMTLAVVSTLGVELWQVLGGGGHRYEAMARRLESGRTAAQVAGEYIRKRTREDETICVWGWTAWRVYYWAQRRACSRIYKPMGVVTTYNTNTEFAAGESVVLRPGPGAQEFLRAFRDTPPRYLVYSPSFTTTFGAKVDPLYEFAELRALIRRDYRLEATFGDLDLLRRDDGPAGP